MRSFAYNEHFEYKTPTFLQSGIYQLVCEYTAPLIASGPARGVRTYISGKDNERIINVFSLNRFQTIEISSGVQIEEAFLYM